MGTAKPFSACRYGSGGAGQSPSQGEPFRARTKVPRTCLSVMPPDLPHLVPPPAFFGASNDVAMVPGLIGVASTSPVVPFRVLPGYRIGAVAMGHAGGIFCGCFGSGNRQTVGQTFGGICKIVRRGVSFLQQVADSLARNRHPISRPRICTPGPQLHSVYKFADCSTNPSKQNVSKRMIILANVSIWPHP